ncbi:MAG: hypothetical protein EA403_04675 [Spirochaetaceae bacterium]|nr:MAG: hypothetical protein EA403_04675 [Spirochaetaceae bacterium]
MKRIMMVLVLVAVAATVTVSAQARGGMMGPAASAEEVELTGRLRLVREQLPVLVSGTNEYVLRISPALSSEFQVTNNQQVSVSGFMVEHQSRDLLGTTRTVMVRSMEVGGTRYVMPNRGSMMGGDAWGGRRSPRDGGRDSGPQGPMPRGGRR